MSQHHFSVTVQENAPNAGATARARCGWDPRLQRFFMSIVTGEDENEERIYDTLFVGGGVADPQDLQAAAADLGVAFPAGLLDALEDDADNNTANRVVNWTENGPDVLAAG